ncbi:protein crumbs homolog 2-like [Haliotis rubra]|uniref:protein crumbs homolog 2-like n=1 Tax=Haliotis rubra TaxID=36100 RepID=UPI001EE5DFCC|nr:protein crumbs homolog 2-like [Haliotis rubra]
MYQAIFVSVLRLLDICEKLQPCVNGGECLQVQKLDSDHQRVRGYKCDCHGTGFYGHHCEHKCHKHPSSDNPLTEACLF